MATKCWHFHPAARRAASVSTQVITVKSMSRRTASRNMRRMVLETPLTSKSIRHQAPGVARYAT